MDLVDLDAEDAAATGSMHELAESSAEGTLGVSCPSSNSSQHGRCPSHDEGAARKVHGQGRPLTKELLLKALNVSRPAPAGRQHTQHANLERQLAKQTHLHLNNLQLSSIDGIGGLPKLETLYLYDNLLEDISPLSALTTLTSLYLQNNRICHLTGLSKLTQLCKLYLEGNHIAALSSLSALHALEELHISNQHLPAGQGLVLQPGCVRPGLRVLCAIGCGLEDSSLGALVGLRELRKLELQGNQLHSLDGQLEQVLRTTPRLISLDLRNNPLCRIPRYCESVIVMSDSMTVLDGEQVTQQQRQVLMRLQIKRLKSQLASESVAEASSSPAPRSGSNSSIQSRSHSGQLRSHFVSPQELSAAAQMQRTGSWRASPTAGRASPSNDSTQLSLVPTPSPAQLPGHVDSNAVGSHHTRATPSPTHTHTPPAHPHSRAGKLPPQAPVAQGPVSDKRRSSASGQGLQLGMQGLQIRPPS